MSPLRDYVLAMVHDHIERMLGCTSMTQIMPKPNSTATRHARRPHGRGGRANLEMLTLFCIPGGAARRAAHDPSSDRRLLVPTAAASASCSARSTTPTIPSGDQKARCLILVRPDRGNLMTRADLDIPRAPFGTCGTTGFSAAALNLIGGRAERRQRALPCLSGRPGKSYH